MINTLIVIGYKPEIGSIDRPCYLNISKKEAINRYLKDNPQVASSDLVKYNMIDEFQFKDEFVATSANPITY